MKSPINDCENVIFVIVNKRCVLNGAKPATKCFKISNGVRQGGLLSPRLFAVYVDDLSKQLIDARSGCFIEHQCINHVMYADNMCLLDTSALGLQKLLDVCYNFSQCHDIVFNSLKSVYIELDADVVNKMIFVRCHRLGKYAANDDGPKFHRSMIIRFMNYNDRQQVWNKRFDIGNKSISISENYANPVEMRRKLLYPVVKKAKSLEQYNKVFLRNDQLHIDNKTYSIQDNLHELPSDLHPRQFSYRTDDKWIVFGGIHSQFNFLSNYFEQTIKYKGIDHSTIEHAYQYEKSARYNDVTTMEKILSAQTPAEAKLHGSRVSNFKRADWDSVKSALLEELLRIKFTPDSELARRLMATTGKSLAEAGKSKTFAIGLPLYQCTLGANQQFDTSKWSMNGNILGTGLMKIRNELNDL